jgi:hypothetical protein
MGGDTDTATEHLIFLPRRQVMQERFESVSHPWYHSTRGNPGMMNERECVSL